VDWIIRPYDDTDAPDVVRLSIRAWAPVFVSFRDVLGDDIFEHLYGDDRRRHQQQEVERVLADEKTSVWVAGQGDQVVGFVAAFLRVDDGMGEISMLAVDPLPGSRTRHAADRHGDRLDPRVGTARRRRLNGRRRRSRSGSTNGREGWLHDVSIDALLQGALDGLASRDRLRSPPMQSLPSFGLAHGQRSGSGAPARMSQRFVRLREDPR
jgi:hypothetical protein